MADRTSKPATREKSKIPAYKLQSDLEVGVDLKESVDTLLDSKIQISLRKILGMAKKEVHDILLDGVKKKRQPRGETVVLQALDAILVRMKRKKLQAFANKQ